MTAPGDDVGPVGAWLIDGARTNFASPLAVAEMCERLVACSIPLWRVSLFVRALHPEVIGSQFIWRQGRDVEVHSAPHAIVTTQDYLTSPVVHVYGTGQVLRRRLVDPACPDDFPVLAEFRAEGITDYLVLPLHFIDGSVHVITWTTRAPAGFTEAQAAGLMSMAGPLARAVEIRMLRHLTNNLLGTYVGRHAGERVLAGHIRRGDTETIGAALWLSDMRGFTARADRMEPRALIELLNLYFDCQVPAINRHGGEVLKYMGDGLLAIFPVARDRPAKQVCRAVLEAAREARDKIVAIEASDGEPVRFGLALHLGEVLYGNIGSGNRLDFTCIGPAVNLAARIEKLTAPVGRTILASGAFAWHCDDAMAPVGRFTLPGFAGEQSIYGLAEEAPASART